MAHVTGATPHPAPSVACHGLLNVLTSFIYIFLTKYCIDYSFVRTNACDIDNRYILCISNFVPISLHTTMQFCTIGIADVVPC